MVSIVSFIRKSKLQPLLLSFAIVALATPLLALKYTQAAEPETPSLQTQLKDLQDQWNQKDTKEETKFALHIRATRLRSLLCLEGAKEYCTETIAAELKKPKHQKIVAKNVDIDKLAHAVAVAETSNCTAGTGGRHLNNCFGIKSKGSFVKFESKEESYEYFKQMWLRKYCDCFPTLSMARQYSGEEGSSWLKRVTLAYNRPYGVEEE